MEKGILYGIGVGPGDPELMTVKSIRTVKECDVIAIPHKEKEKCMALRIALGAIPELEDKEYITIDMPMTKDPLRLENAYQSGANKLVSLLDSGKNVGFLTIGDPTVYSTYMYLHKRVVDRGYQAKIIPGITSFCAAAAELGISLCENKDELHIIPGTYQPTAAFAYPGVKVLMKNNLAESLRVLKAGNYDASMVENCGLPNQKVYRSVDEIPEDSGYFSLMIVKNK